MKLVRKSFFLLAALLFALVLAACSKETVLSTAEPMPLASPSPAQDAVASAVPPAALPSDGKKMTLDDITARLKKEHPGTEVTVLGTTEIGTGYLLVEYDMKTSTNSFALCNLLSGDIDNLPVMDAVLKKAVSENYFVFEDRGDYTDSAFRFFPTIVRCFRAYGGDKPADAYSAFEAVTERELFTLDRSVKSGSKPHEVLGDINITYNGLELLFTPEEGKEGWFIADATDIPPTATAYDAGTNTFSIQMDVDLVGDGIKTGEMIRTDDNRYIASYQVTKSQGGIDGSSRVTVAVTLRDTAGRYTISRGTLPDGKNVDGFPYLSLSFTGEPDFPLDY